MEHKESISCDCLIGECLDYDDTSVVTEKELYERANGLRWNMVDYFDFRKSVNLFRFRFCPECGRKIDWGAMKKRAKEFDAAKKGGAK